VLKTSAEKDSPTHADRSSEKAVSNYRRNLLSANFESSASVNDKSREMTSSIQQFSSAIFLLAKQEAHCRIE